jgi:alkylation response protein AidB-like acyl-CoA dehydrogenase
MLTGQPTLDPGPAALVAARELASQLSARAGEADELRTMPPDLVAAARAAGLFRLAMPRALGGLELPPDEIVRIGEELCRADGSVGWTIMVGNGSAFLAWLDPAAATELLAGQTDVLCACVFAPTGRLTPTGARSGGGGSTGAGPTGAGSTGAGSTGARPDSTDSGFQLAGSWGLASGCLHADWFITGGLVSDGDGPRLLPGLGPDWRLAVFPAGAGSVVDNWDATGLRGTGSHDIVADAVPVLERHTMAPFFSPARHDGPLWRFPFFTLVGTLFVGFPLGVGRRALDELAAFAPTKFRPPGPGSIAEDGDLQVALTRAEGGLQAARALVFDALGEMWRSACAGDVPDVAQRARFLLATQQAMRAATEAVDTAYRYTGAAALRADHPVQRCFRDLHAGAQHIYFSPAAVKRYAKVRLGIEQQTFWF